jgi:hypothetical protein
MAGPRRRRRGPRPAPRKVTIRLTDAEYRAIRQAASRPGRGVSLSRYVAEAALAAAGATPPPPTPRRSPSKLVMAEIMDAVTAVNRVGNNLNQLAREKNATGQRPAGTHVEIQRALNALDRLTKVTDSATPDGNA